MKHTALYVLYAVLASLFVCVGLLIPVYYKAVNTPAYPDAYVQAGIVRALTAGSIALVVTLSAVAVYALVRFIKWTWNHDK